MVSSWVILEILKEEERKVQNTSAKTNEVSPIPSRSTGSSLKSELKTEKYECKEKWATSKDSEKRPKAEAHLLALSIKEKQNNLTCRICLKIAKIPIFGSIDFSKDLNTFAGIQVSPKDAFPRYLCQPCFTSLQSAVLLRKTAQESDQILKQALQDFNACTGVKIHNENAVNKESTVQTINNDYSEEDALNRVAEILFNLDNDDDILQEEKTDPPQLKKHLSIKIRDQICPICNEKNFTNWSLKRHLRKIHNCPIQKDFMCDVCGNKFIDNTQLKIHKATHSLKELPFKCELCPYRGRFRDSVKRHMRTHTGEKRYLCTYCPKRFINSGNMYVHMQQHKKIVRFECDLCGAGFFRKSHLNLHVKKIHLGIKDVICDTCGMAFFTKDNLREHEVKVHKRAKKQPGKTPLYVLLEQKKQKEQAQVNVDTP